jgi:glycosyltransferase involved in cell wall biosynthesis
VSRRKVTFCVYDKPDSIGGPITWIQRLIPPLRDRGLDPRCLFLVHWGDTGPALEALRDEGIVCEAITAPVRTVERVKWILSRLHADPPDVFVPNLVVAGYYAGRWVRRAGIPTIGILHSDDAYYRAIQDEFVFGDPRYRVSSVVCVSKELERQVLKRNPRDVVVRRIPYGVPIPDTITKPSHDVFRIAYVGRLAQEQKRILDVTRALCRAVTEIPNTEAVIYGDGPERKQVEEIIRQCANPRIRLAGALPSDEVQRELRDVHAIVLLSDYEGLPIALLEAMACGCVPVCTDMRSGIEEVITPGVSGLISPDRNEAFVNALLTLRRDRHVWMSLSSGAREAASKFSMNVSANSWADMIAGEPRDGFNRGLVPWRLDLPAFNPSLESAEQRARPHNEFDRLYVRGRMLLGRLRRGITS